MDGLANASRTDGSLLKELGLSNAALTENNNKLTAEIVRVNGTNRWLHRELAKARELAGAPAPAPLKETEVELSAEQKAEAKTKKQKARRKGKGKPGS